MGPEEEETPAETEETLEPVTLIVDSVTVTLSQPDD